MTHTSLTARREAPARRRTRAGRLRHDLESYLVGYKTMPPLSMVGTGVIIIALALGYYYFKKASLLPQHRNVEHKPASEKQADGAGTKAHAG
jgi:hypothetical protein